MNISDIILPLHLFILAFSALTLLQADHLGFSWVRGKLLTLDEKKVTKLHHRMWYGLSGMIVTGVMLFWPLHQYLLTRQQFYVKMAFVIALVVNGLAIGHLQRVAFVKPYRDLAMKEKLPLFISGGVSTLCWVGAAIGGFFLLP